MSTHLLLWLLALLTPLTASGMAHEKGIIRLASKEVPIGGELGLQGEKLPKSATLRLELRSALETFSLAEVRTNAAGRFQARLTLPADAGAGSYTVVALAPDGDVAARAQMVVLAAAPAHATEHGATDSTPTRTASPHPTAETMKLAVATTGGERAAILTIIAACLGGGLTLLRGSRRRHA